MNVPFDDGRKHSIPYQWGSTSFSVNRDVYTGDISPTDILFDPPAKGREEGVEGVAELLDPALASMPEANPPADAPAGSFIAVCDQATQEVYDQLWTRLRK